MKKLVLILIAAGTFLILPSVSQAQSPLADQQSANTELVQLTEQLNRVAVNLGHIASFLKSQPHSDTNTDKSCTLSHKLGILQKNLRKTAQKIDQIQADRAMQPVKEAEDDDDLQDLV
jgi:hypothetical protein